MPHGLPGETRKARQIPAVHAQAFLVALEEEHPPDKDALHRLKHRVAKRLAIDVPRDGTLLASLKPRDRERWRPLLLQKPMRTSSGVAIVAVMSSPAGCPHGKCTFCPGGPEIGVPQSYTGHEPSTMRAIAHGYDPYRITRSRLRQLRDNGHPIDKVDVIIQGGTFPAREAAYQDWFVAAIYAALNDGPGDGNWDLPWAEVTQKERHARLLALQIKNQDAESRCIGLTVETKPDWCFEEHIDTMLMHGVTRVELGLQTFDDATLHLNHRGHDVADAARAMQLVRDAGLKVCVHMMPGLPRPPHRKVDQAMDLADARALWDDPRWRPDMLKVYPTLVVGETAIKAWWESGQYKPLDTADATKLVAKMLADVPVYCRVQRVDRDIPTTQVTAGVQNTNLRQLAERGIAPRDLRAREPGRKNGADPERIVLQRLDYEASGSTEVFLSLEDPHADVVVAYLRLRRLGLPHRKEMGPPGHPRAVIRELKVAGSQVPLGEHQISAWQHRGFGKQLMDEAAKIAAGWGCQQLLVTAGVGVRRYYEARGFAPLGPYMVRALEPQNATSIPP